LNPVFIEEKDLILKINQPFDFPRANAWGLLRFDNMDSTDADPSGTRNSEADRREI
jgi:hypothetical protein